MLPIHHNHASSSSSSSSSSSIIDRLVLEQQENDNTHGETAMSAKMTSKWMFPDGKYMKLNTDGSSKRNPRHTSFGGLIRDNEGRWLCGYMGKLEDQWYDSREAEIWGIYKGLCLIEDRNMSNLIIETDCGDAISAIHIGEEPLMLEKKAIKTIMGLRNCFLVHTRRDGNQCADQLASLGKSQSDEYVVLENAPELLKPYLSKDIESALVFQRHGCW